METLLLVDGNAIMHRAYHAIPPFKTKSGIPTNVIYGFFNMIHKAIQDFHPTHVAICFDTPSQTFRQKLHEEYQAQRPAMEDEFKQQIPLLKELIDKSGVYQEEQDGLEADDIIGTITQQAKKRKMRTLILTGDKDIMQLVNHHVFVISPLIGLSKIKMYDVNEVAEKIGVKPNMIPDFKALAGDPSDNYKGAKGIGPKTAVKLLEQFGSVESLLKNLNKVDEKYRKILSEHRENILLSKKLATIVTDAKVKFHWDQARFDRFPQSFKEELEKYEMRSLINRFFGERNDKKREATNKKQTNTKKSQENKDQITMF